MDIKMRSAIHEAGHVVAHIHYWTKSQGDLTLKQKHSAISVVKAEHLAAVDCDLRAYIVSLVYCSGYAALVASGLAPSEAEVGASDDFEHATKLLEQWKVPLTLEEVKADAVGLMSQPNYISAVESIANCALEHGSVPSDTLKTLSAPIYLLKEDLDGDELSEFLKRGGACIVCPCRGYLPVSLEDHK